MVIIRGWQSGSIAHPQHYSLPGCCRESTDTSAEFDSKKGAFALLYAIIPSVKVGGTDIPVFLPLIYLLKEF